MTINRPPRDGRMAFVRSPDNISIELLQKGDALAAGRALGVDAEHRRMVGWRDRRFLGLVGTEHPIIPAPMAGAAGVELCVAAIDGGGARLAAVCAASPDQVRKQVADVRSSASGPLNLNFFCHTMPGDADDSAWRALLRPYYDEFGVQPENGGTLRLPFDDAMCAVVEEVRPEVVSFHFGLPDERLLDRVKATGAVVFGNATTVEEARWLEQRGVEA